MKILFLPLAHPTPRPPHPPPPPTFPPASSKTPPGSSSTLPLLLLLFPGTPSCKIIYMSLERRTFLGPCVGCLASSSSAALAAADATPRIHAVGRRAEGVILHVEPRSEIGCLAISSMSSTSICRPCQCCKKRLEVRAIFQPPFLPGVAQLDSMAWSTSAASSARAVKDENEENQADDDMGSPDARAGGEPLMFGRKCRASMLLEYRDSGFREKFAKYTEQEAKAYCLKEPGEFRTAAMLHFLYTNADEAFEELHLGPDNDPANASGNTPQASDARASGDNQHQRQNAKALFSSAT